MITFLFQEAQVDELEAQLQNTQADLKSARKRIEQLHGALKDHEEEYSGDEQYTSRSIDDSLGDGLSLEDSYSLGDEESFDLSDDDEDDLVVPKRSARGLNRAKLHSNEPSPALGRKKDLSPALSDKRRKSSSKDPEEEEEDGFEAARKARQQRLKQLEDEEVEFEVARKARQERLKDLNDKEDLKSSRKPKATNFDLDNDQEETKSSSFKRDKKVYDDDEDDDEDDDDLEEFLLKQRERMKKLEDSDDDDVGVSTVKATHGASSRVSNDALSSVRDKGEQSHVTNGNSNGVVGSSSRKSESREQSEEPNVPSHRRESELEEHAASRYRRKRQRRRTIEQLTSPEHVSEANGVDL